MRVCVCVSICELHVPKDTMNDGEQQNTLCKLRYPVLSIAIHCLAVSKRLQTKRVHRPTAGSDS